jgi:hypothetical protein
VTRPLRLPPGRGPWLAIATVAGARGARRAAARHRASGHRGRADHRVQAAGPLDRAIPDLAAQALATGQTGSAACGSKGRRRHVGLSGQISLDVHAMRVPSRPRVRRHAALPRQPGAATALIVGTRGVTGYALAEAAVCDRCAAIGQQPRPARNETARSQDDGWSLVAFSY